MKMAVLNAANSTVASSPRIAPSPSMHETSGRSRVPSRCLQLDVVRVPQDIGLAICVA